MAAGRLGRAAVLPVRRAPKTSEMPSPGEESAFQTQTVANAASVISSGVLSSSPISFALSSTRRQHVARVVQRRGDLARRRTPRPGARRRRVFFFSSAITAPSSSSHADRRLGHHLEEAVRVRAAPVAMLPVWNHMSRRIALPPSASCASAERLHRGAERRVARVLLRRTARRRRGTPAGSRRRPDRACGRRGPSPGCGSCPRRC